MNMELAVTNTSAELYPVTLEPSVAEQPWGLSEDFSAEESALRGFSGTLLMAAGNSKAAAGPLAGRSLGYLRQLWGSRLVGSTSGGDPDAPLPAELKLKRTESTALAVSLTEDSLWYVLGVEEDSAVHAGFNPGLDFREAAEAAGGDLGRWTEFMPESMAREGQCLFLPQTAPLLMGTGLTLAQIGPPAQQLLTWPLPGPGVQGLKLAESGRPPVWSAPQTLEPGRMEIYRGPRLTVQLITTSHLSDLVSQEAATFLWPIAGQGRIRARGPAPVTRLQPGRVVMMPAGLGRYAIESGGSVSYLLIEAS